jgi:hypothetical protein
MWGNSFLNVGKFDVGNSGKCWEMWGKCGECGKRGGKVRKCGKKCGGFWLPFLAKHVGKLRVWEGRR